MSQNSILDLLQDVEQRLTEQKLATRVASSETVDEAYHRIAESYSSLTDSNGIVLQMSEPYLRLLGYNREEVVGKHFSMLLFPESKVMATQHQQDYIRGIYHVPPTWILQHKSGRSLKVHVDAVRITDHEGNRYKLAVITPLDNS